MAKKRNRDNRRVQSPAPTYGGNRAASIYHSDDEFIGDEPQDFPLVESTSHLTGEVFDPMAHLEQEQPEEFEGEAQDNQEDAQIVGEGGQQAESISDPRFEGKSPEEILKSYKELEAKFNERNDELGNYRKMFDQHVQQQAFQQNQPPTPDPRKSEKENQELLEEMLANPQAFLQRVEQRVFNNLGNLAARNEMTSVMQKHKDVLSSNDFQKWLVSNVPRKVAELADNDPQAFNMIVNLYKNNTAPQQVAQQAQEQAVTRRRVAENAAGIPSGGTVRAKPVYTRRMIQDMMMNDPKKYELLYPDILQAYKEGRVKQ